MVSVLGSLQSSQLVSHVTVLNTRVYNAQCALHYDLLHVLVRFALGLRCNEIPGKSLFRRQPPISWRAQLWHLWAILKT